MRIDSITLLLPNNKPTYFFGDVISIELSVNCDEPVEGARIGIGLIREGIRISTFHSQPINFLEKRVDYKVRCSIPGNLLLPGIFSLVVGAHLARNGQGLDYVDFEVPFEISELANNGSNPWDTKNTGLVQVDSKWIVD